ncbi:RNA polymerase sigma-70 factor, ECF subfamily [Lachnospiraceae bacterium XBB1006]|nr:RNA polymerase sigma-70 factor, ECF subfamily [Lachnospiraceae bacterium XBB1006]
MTIQELENCMEQFGDSLYSFCRKLCMDQEQAEELYQDVWVKALTDMPRIRAEDNVKSYLLSIAVGIWKNRKKKYAVRQRIAPAVAITEEMTEVLSDNRDATVEEILLKERKQAVLEAVNGLEDTYRIPVLLFYMEEQSVKEIAHALHLPYGTVKRRLWVARNKLSNELEGYIDE